MKSKVLVLGTVMTATFVTQGQVYAYSVFVDNDSTVYPTWSDTDANGVAFFSRTDRSSDINGDSRASGTNCWGGHYSYHWDVPTNDATTRKYNLSAYVNNVNFTNDNATYYMSGSKVGVVHQYSAKGGWIWVGTAWDYSTLHVTVDSYDSNYPAVMSGSMYAPPTRTGADQINVWY